jgi:Uma2 family endonuclease
MFVSTLIKADRPQGRERTLRSASIGQKVAPCHLGGTMVAVLSTVPIGYGRPFTRADLERMPDDGRRYELIDGVLYVSAAPGRRHQQAVLELAVVLRAACPPDLEVLIAPFAVGLAGDTEIHPDVLVARRDKLTAKDLPGAPELAVEVLWPTTRETDLHAKRKRFERAGTPSFWVVDPATRAGEARLIAWTLGYDGRYRRISDVIGDSAFRAQQPYPVTLVPAALVR